MPAKSQVRTLRINSTASIPQDAWTSVMVANNPGFWVWLEEDEKIKVRIFVIGGKTSNKVKRSFALLAGGEGVDTVVSLLEKDQAGSVTTNATLNLDYLVDRPSLDPVLEHLKLDGLIDDGILPHVQERRVGEYYLNVVSVPVLTQLPVEDDIGMGATLAMFCQLEHTNSSQADATYDNRLFVGCDFDGERSEKRERYMMLPRAANVGLEPRAFLSLGLDGIVHIRTFACVNRTEV